MDAHTFLEISSWSMLGTGAVTLVACLLITAPYGRYSTSKGWGPLVPAQLAWFLMESPNLWIPLLFWSTDNAPKLAEKALPNCILLLFFVLHYFHRAVIYPLRMQARIAAPMPVSVAFLAFAFCCWNGLNQSIALTLLQEYPEGYETHPRFLCGMAIAATGMALNIHADTHLLNLRKDPSDRTYKIPRGGLFELVSAANYSGEILEWTGFAIASWSLPGAAFAIYTFSNTAPRGYKHHLFYLEKFRDEYPKNRKAVIPFIW